MNEIHTKTFLGRRVILPVLTGVVVLAAWKLLVVAQAISPETLPPPEAVLRRWAQLIVAREYYISILATARLTALGLGIGIAIGVPLGALAGMWPGARQALWPYVHAVRGLPAVALVPVLLALVPSVAARPLIIGISCGATIAASCADGWRSAAPERLDFAATAGLSGWRLLLFLYLPEVGPELIVGVRIASGLALILSVVLEMLLGQNHGLGTYISTHSDTDRAAVFAVVATLALLGVGISALVDAASRTILFWEK